MENVENQDATQQSHWKGIKIRHTSLCLVGKGPD